MGRRSKVTQLPAEVRAWLDQALAGNNFSEYQALAQDLAKRGYAIGKSSIQRYGTKIEEKIAAIKASTEAAVLLQKAAPDDADLRSGAVLSMIQTENFNILMKLQDDGVEFEPERRAKVLASLGKSVAPLVQASLRQKKHEIEIRSKVTAAADAVAKVAQKGGLSKGAVEQIRSQILGIAT